MTRGGVMTVLKFKQAINTYKSYTLEIGNKYDDVGLFHSIHGNFIFDKCAVILNGTVYILLSSEHNQVSIKADNIRKITKKSNNSLDTYLICCIGDVCNTKFTLTLRCYL